MYVSDVLKERKQPVETIEASEPLTAAVARLAESKVRSLVVLERDGVVGILTVRDVLGCIHRDGDGALKGELRAAMTPDPVTVTPETGLDDATAILMKQRVSYLPVIEDGKLAGIITLADVLGEHLDEARALNDDLRGYIHGPYTR